MHSRLDHSPAGTRAMVTISPRLASSSLPVWPWVACLTAAVLAVCRVEAVNADLQWDSHPQTPFHHAGNNSNTTCLKHQQQYALITRLCLPKWMQELGSWQERGRRLRGPIEDMAEVNCYLRPRADDAAAILRAMPSSMRDVARGFCCARSSNAPCESISNVRGDTICRYSQAYCKNKTESLCMA